MENCFGISKFEHKFDFADDTCVLIYAPNGMMKSSFARTFECISKDDKKSVPCDRIYPQRKTNCTVKCDGKSIDPKSIFVANAESDIATDNRITTFLASKELKERYDSIYQELDKVKNAKARLSRLFEQEKQILCFHAFSLLRRIFVKPGTFMISDITMSSIKKVMSRSS